jgi:hypothetical protein
MDPSTVSLTEYIMRIVTHADVERACLVMILVYVDRICQRVPSFAVTTTTVHPFILASVTVASKALCDDFHRNAYYASIAGMATVDLNKLELELLDLIDWDVAVSGAVVQDY